MEARPKPGRRRRSTRSPGAKIRRDDEIVAIVRMIREKRARLDELEREARELRLQLKAVGLSVGAQPTRGPRPRPPRPARRHIWPTSIAGRAAAALQKAGTPLRVEQLLRAIERAWGKKVERATLVGQLARDVRKGRLFRRTAPNEYALAEWTPRRRRR